MRPLILLMPLLLTACTLIVAPTPTPAPTPLPKAHAEQLWYALSLQLMTKEIFTDAAQSAVAGDLSGEQAIPMMLYTAALMRACHEALSQEYPAIFASHHTVAVSQYQALQDIGGRWLQDGTLLSADVPAELESVPARASLEAYTDWLMAHGYSQDDIDAIDAQLREALHAAFATPTP